MEIIINNLPENTFPSGEVPPETVTEINRTVILVLTKIAELYNISPQAEVGLVWTDNEHIRNLNRQYRGIDAATDVLSFALNDEQARPDAKSEPQILNGQTEDVLSGQEILLGDIVISLETAAEQAAEYGHSLVREIAFLTVHGMLHILGYDHEEESDSSEMRQEEKHILQVLGIGRN